MQCHRYIYKKLYSETVQALTLHLSKELHHFAYLDWRIKTSSIVIGDGMLEKFFSYVCFHQQKISEKRELKACCVTRNDAKHLYFKEKRKHRMTKNPKWS